MKNKQTYREKLREIIDNWFDDKYSGYNSKLVEAITKEFFIEEKKINRKS